MIQGRLAKHEVVENGDAVAFGKKGRNHDGTEVPGAPGDENGERVVIHGSFAGMVEDFMQALNLWREIVRIIADKETTVVSKVGIRDTAVDDIVVVVSNNVVFEKTAACNHPKADIRFP